MKSKYDICHTLLPYLNTHFNMHACVVGHYQAHITSAHMHRPRSQGFCDVGCAHTLTTAGTVEKKCFTSPCESAPNTMHKEQQREAEIVSVLTV